MREQIHQEDPLAGDVDRFVHPDETRTDEQIARDRQYEVTPYGNDASDEYWAEYDEYHGTVNGGEEAEPEEDKPTTIIEEHPAYRGQNSQMNVTTVNGRTHHTNSSAIQKLRDEGLDDEQIGLHLDKEQDERRSKIRANNAALLSQVEEPDYDGSDPLAGDVDRFVHPDETKE